MKKEKIDAFLWYRIRDITKMEPRNVLPKLLELLESTSPKSFRTATQNRALHLFFTQLSNECMEKGIDMKMLVKKETPIPATPENIKHLWKLVQEALFKIESTTELEKTGQIELVYDTMNRIFTERTHGEITFPPFPFDPEKLKALEDSIRPY